MFLTLCRRVRAPNHPGRRQPATSGPMRAPRRRGQRPIPAMAALAPTVAIGARMHRESLAQDSSALGQSSKSDPYAPWRLRSVARGLGNSVALCQPERRTRVDSPSRHRLVRAAAMAKSAASHARKVSRIARVLRRGGFCTVQKKGRRVRHGPARRLTESARACRDRHAGVPPPVGTGCPRIVCERLGCAVQPASWSLMLLQS